MTLAANPEFGTRPGGMASCSGSMGLTTCSSSNSATAEAAPEIGVGADHDEGPALAEHPSHGEQEGRSGGRGDGRARVARPVAADPSGGADGKVPCAGTVSAARATGRQALCPQFAHILLAEITCVLMMPRLPPDLCISRANVVACDRFSPSHGANAGSADPDAPWAVEVPSAQSSEAMCVLRCVLKVPRRPSTL